MARYTEGVMSDGAATLKDGRPMTISEILAALNRNGPTAREPLRRAWYSALVWAAAHEGEGLEAGMAAFNDWHEGYCMEAAAAKVLQDKVGAPRQVRHDQGRY